MKSIKKSPLFLGIAGILGGLVSSEVVASAFIEVGDAQLRHHLNVLSDYGVIQTSLTSWPLNWSSISRDIDAADANQLSRSVAWSFQYVRFEIERQTDAFNSTLSNFNSSGPTPFQDFGDRVREEKALSVKFDFLASNVTGNIQLNAVEELDDADAIADGTYLAIVLDNWVWGLGKHDRWWGPGWQSSLLISNFSRPAPSVFVKRNQDDAFELPVLDWLGNWQFELFLSEYTENEFDDAQDVVLGGARLSFQPLPGLDIALSQLRLDGSELAPNVVLSGQTEDDFWDKAINGFDVRYGFSLGPFAHGFYTQIVGDEPFLTSDAIGLFGYDLSFQTESSSSRIAIEWTNTTANFLEDERVNVTNVIDEVTQGLNYYSRNLGASIGADAEAVTLYGQHYFSNNWEASWKLGRVEQAKGANGQLLLTDSVDYVNLEVGRVVNDKLKVRVSGYWLSDSIRLNEQEVESGASIELIYRY